MLCTHFRKLAMISANILAIFSVVCAQECPRNPVTSATCSSDHTYIDANSMVHVAGNCGSGGVCICSSDFGGKACDVPIKAEASNIMMNAWVFLAKSCWSANAEGTVSIGIHFKPWTCSQTLGCHPATNFSDADLPMVMFYSSYDTSFSQAVLQSFSTSALGGSSDSSNPPCLGNNAVFKEQIWCGQIIDKQVRSHLAQHLRTDRSTDDAS